jgi:hypothetical protein
MITSSNILSVEHRQALKNIMIEEIGHNLCALPSTPLYQSYGHMHEKYKNETCVSNLINRALKEAELITNQKLNILRCWFLVSKKDSVFNFHFHENTYITAVYFVENCKNHGTIFRVNNSNLQLLCEDNTIITFDPQIYHTPPDWSGKDRYSVAIDFKLKTD